MIKNILCVLFGFCCLAFSYCLPLIEKASSPKNVCPYLNSPQKVIAHAGGVIEGKRYTNSLEALKKSFQKNIRFIELDLLETTDEDVVGAHDWKRLYRSLKMPETNQPVSFEEIKTLKIDGKYTLLNSEQIVKEFQKHPENILVTDKITNIPLLKKKFYPLMSRMIVEVPSLELYQQALENGFFPALNVTSLSSEELKFLKRHHVKAVVLSYDFMKKNKKAIKKLEKEGVCRLTYTINRSKDVRKYKSLLNLYYSDYLN